MKVDLFLGFYTNIFIKLLTLIMEKEMQCFGFT